MSEAASGERPEEKKTEAKQAVVEPRPTRIDGGKQLHPLKLINDLVMRGVLVFAGDEQAQINALLVEEKSGKVWPLTDELRQKLGELLLQATLHNPAEAARVCLEQYPPLDRGERWQQENALIEQIIAEVRAFGAAAVTAAEAKEHGVPSAGEAKGENPPLFPRQQFYPQLPQPQAHLSVAELLGILTSQGLLTLGNNALKAQTNYQELLDHARKNDLVAWQRMLTVDVALHNAAALRDYATRLLAHDQQPFVRRFLTEVLQRAVDLREAPEQQAAVQAQFGGHFLCGDLHGNVLNAVHFARSAGKIHLSQKNMEELAAICTRHRDHIGSKEIDRFRELLNNIEFDVHDSENQKFLLRFLGDMLADRGPSDLLTLEFLKVLDDAGILYEIIVSNHDMEFLRQYELARAAYQQAVAAGQNGDEAFRQQLKQFLSDDTNPGATVKLEQQPSFRHMAQLIIDGHIQPGHLMNLVERHYKPKLKALNYSLRQGADGQSLLDISFHAPVANPRAVTKAFADFYRIDYDESSPQALMRTIDAINQQFQLEVRKGSVARRYQEMCSAEGGKGLPDAVLLAVDPIYYSSMHRHKGQHHSNNLITTPDAPAWQNWRLCVTHGHDGHGIAFAADMNNLDGGLGKRSSGSEFNADNHNLIGVAPLATYYSRPKPAPAHEAKSTATGKHAKDAKKAARKPKPASTEATKPARKPLPKSLSLRTDWMPYVFAGSATDNKDLLRRELRDKKFEIAQEIYQQVDNGQLQSPSNAERDLIFNQLLGFREFSDPPKPWTDNLATFREQMVLFMQCQYGEQDARARYQAWFDTKMATLLVRGHTSKLRVGGGVVSVMAAVAVLSTIGNTGPGGQLPAILADATQSSHITPEMFILVMVLAALLLIMGVALTCSGADRLAPQQPLHDLVQKAGIPAISYRVLQDSFLAEVVNTQESVKKGSSQGIAIKQGRELLRILAAMEKLAPGDEDARQALITHCGDVEREFIQELTRLPELAALREQKGERSTTVDADQVSAALESTQLPQQQLIMAELEQIAVVRAALEGGPKIHPNTRELLQAQVLTSAKTVYREAIAALKEKRKDNNSDPGFRPYVESVAKILAQPQAQAKRGFFACLSDGEQDSSPSSAPVPRPRA